MVLSPVSNLHSEKKIPFQDNEICNYTLVHMVLNWFLAQKCPGSGAGKKKKKYIISPETRQNLFPTAICMVKIATGNRPIATDTWF